MPRELNGTLYRNGPNPQFDAPGAHWFVGDGMLHAFHLENGRASYRNRWVRTPKWQAEHDAGRALFGGFGRKLPDAPAALTDGGVANTNIVFHGGRLLALEEAHLPTEIEPGTLATRGYCNYGGRHRRALHRTSQDRSRDRRDGVLRLQRLGPLYAYPLLRLRQRVGQGDALRSFRGALCQHGA